MVRLKSVSPAIGLMSLAIAGQAAALHNRGDTHAAHRRIHENHVREPSVVTNVVGGPTVVVYQFAGQDLELSEVCNGIRNGTFVWAEDTSDVPDCKAYGLTSTPTPTAHSTAPAVSATPVPASPSANTPIAAHANFEVESSSKSAAPATSTSAVHADSNNDIHGLTGFDAKIAVNVNVDKDFPDGQIDCDTFPSAYGAVPIDWVQLGGWSGIQYTTTQNGAVANINTAVAGNKCQNVGDGSTAFCSYSCPAGYQKSQWPATQGNADKAVSVGGLQCGTDGKLHLTNPSLSKKLCIPGTGQVTVHNKLSASNAICRTDYPGTEDETIAMVTQKSAISQLTCPDASSYYKHLGKATTAEYYVNMKGVSVDQACIWGQDGSNKGNWAPTVFGVGMDENGKTWLSIMSTIQNNPVSYQDLDFTVELQGDFGGAACFYTNGHYCTSGSPGSYDPKNCQSVKQYPGLVPGCTIELLSGNATYVLTD